MFYPRIALVALTPGRAWACTENLRVVMMPTLLSLLALEVVIMTTNGAASNDDVGIRITKFSVWLAGKICAELKIHCRPIVTHSIFSKVVMQLLNFQPNLTEVCPQGSALVQYNFMAWRWTGDKPLSEPMMTQSIDAYLHHQASMF